MNDCSKSKKAIIIGAGPAGLTAAYELLKRTDIIPIILEKSGDIGGISKTVQYKGNRIDIGGHRFFSKSDRVMNWWMNIMPVEAAGNFTIAYQNKSRDISATNGASKDLDKVMLVRQRLSRIYFLRKFFTYPIQLSFDTLTKLGISTTLAILFSYLKAQLLPRKPEQNLEDFMINRFGKTLYQLFFKDYTEKVWGIPCNSISAEWGAQRIKGVSISKALQHAIQTTLKRKQKHRDLSQKDTETSLIEQFLYPKYGPGQLWEEVARQVQEMGGEIRMHQQVMRMYPAHNNNSITAIATTNNITGETSYLEGDYFFSTMPIQELIGGLDGSIPDDVRHVASGLQYRDFITVGILLKKLSFQDKRSGEWKPLDLKDTWIYIQEKEVKVGRLQLFNNWSPYMVKDPDTVWVGMEFFCNTDDNFWQLPDAEIKQRAIQELEKIGLASPANVLDATVLRMEKTYPAYFGTYNRFEVIREFTDQFENLFLVGRNGMHKYNNSDHSMLTAMVAVDNICAGISSKANIWAINTEQEYHEEKTAAAPPLPKAANAEKTSSQLSFKNFVFHTPVNRNWLWVISGCLLLQFILFKLRYPFANYMYDSYAYIAGAFFNMDINIWPIGYSKFLTIFGAFTHSDNAVVLFQYLFLEACILYFVFTLLYLLQPGKIVTMLLLLFGTFNPLFVYTSNYISSDALFTGLSLIWAAQLIWMLTSPRPGQIWLHVLVLLLAFTIRNNALYYPFISAGVLLLSQLPWRRKVLAVGLCFILIGNFLWQSANKYQALTGQRQMNAFAGWQMATNALLMYRNLPDSWGEQVPEKMMPLHRLVTRHLDSISKVKIRPDTIASLYYLWNERAPLKKYMHSVSGIQNTEYYPNMFNEWATVAPLYGAYGQYIIRRHPLAYAQYYIWPNIQQYYTPPLEVLGVYNMGSDTVASIASTWFKYKSQKIKNISIDYRTKMIYPYPFLVTILNLIFLCSVAGFLIMGGIKKANKILLRIALLMIGIWMINFGFSILAAPIVLRYQIFPTILIFSISAVLIEFIYRSDQVTAGAVTQINEKLEPVLS